MLELKRRWIKKVLYEMKGKFSKWIHSPGGIASIVLALGCIALALIDYLAFDTRPHSYVSGSITEIIGIIITVIFVQVLFERNNIEKQRVDEKNKILRANKVVSLIIRHYEIFLHCMTHNISELTTIVPSLEHDYLIADIGQCHHPCLLLDYAHSDSYVSLFFKNEYKLRDIFISITQNIDFTFFTDLSDLILEYIDVSIKYDSSDAILANEKFYFQPDTTNRKQVSSTIQETLAKCGQDYMDGLASGKSHKSNIMYPYVRLFLLTQTQRKLLIKYRNYVRQIEK